MLMNGKKRGTGREAEYNVWILRLHNRGSRSQMGYRGEVPVEV